MKSRLGWRATPKGLPTVASNRSETRVAGEGGARGRAVDIGHLDPECFLFSELADFDLALREEPEVEDTEQFELVAEQIKERFRDANSKFPAFPMIAVRVLDLVRLERTNINELVRLLSQDPSLVIQMLRVANSAYYSRGEEVMTIRNAVIRLGMRETAIVATAVSSYSLFDMANKNTDPRLDELLMQMRHHSLTCGFAASWFAMEVSNGYTFRVDADRAFLGGMLHDIGKIVALRTTSELINSEAVDRERTLRVFEPVVESLHNELGVSVVQTWNLPDYVAGICRDHHQNGVEPAAIPAEVHIIRIVSGMNEMRWNSNYPSKLEQEVRDSLDAIKIGPARARALATEIRTFAARTDELLS